MSATPSAPLVVALAPRLRRAIELVYALEGVVGVRLWEWPGTVALGIATSPPGREEILRRADTATASFREPGERWELGFLEAESACAPLPLPTPTPTSAPLLPAK